MASLTTQTSKSISHLRTPLVRSTSLSNLLGGGKKVFLKLDNCQRSGSFKDRGMASLIRAHQQKSERPLRRLISSSGGNAGLAVATMAQLSNQLNHVNSISDENYLHCEVFVPQTTSELAIERIRAVNATVHIGGANWDEANAKANQRMDELRESGEECLFCHPFEGEDTWLGHSSLVSEIVEDLSEDEMDCIVCSVGGGGLLNGICLGLRNHGMSDRVSLITAETEGSDCFYQSKQAGELVTLPGITSVATSLGARTPQASTLRMSAEYSRECVPCRVSDKQAISAMKRFLNEHRFLVEPACAAALSLLYDEHHRRVFDQFERIVIEVCGGSGVSLEKFHQLCDQFGV